MAMVPETGLDTGWSLTDLLAGISGRPAGAWQGVKVRGIAIDSRQVRPGDLFVALAGQHTSGEEFLREAALCGAVAAVVHQDYRGPLPLPGLGVDHPRRVLADVAARYYGSPSKELFVAGVTGTNGKSTYVNMLAQVFAAAGQPTGYWSTPEVYTGSRRFRPILTTPEAHDLQGFLRQLREAGLTHTCFEVSSHGILQERVRNIAFDVGAVTNVSEDHLDYHGDFHDYVATKQSFVEGLEEQAVCFLNDDDPWVREMGRNARARVIRYGFAAEGIRARNPVYSPRGTRFTVELHVPLGREGPGEFPIELPVLGRHNVQNSLAVIGTALAAGVGREEIRAALARFRPPARRLETEQVGPYAVINDVAMNEASYQAALETMELLRFPQLVVVNAIRGNRGAGVNAAIARVLAQWNRRLHFAPLVVSLSRSHVACYEADYDVREEELAAFLAASREEGLEVSVHEELPEAIAEGVDRLLPGGALLLLGTFGMDDGHFLVRDLLRKRLHPKPPGS